MKVKMEPKMATKFKVGDKVRLRDNVNLNHGGPVAITMMRKALAERQVLTVNRLSPMVSYYPVIVRMKEGDECDSVLGFSEDELEPVAKFKAGDKVRLKAGVTQNRCYSTDSQRADRERAIGVVSRTPSDNTLGEVGVMWPQAMSLCWFPPSDLELIEPHVPACPQPEQRPDAVRIQELIEANNALVERERAAKRIQKQLAEWNETLMGQIQDARHTRREMTQVQDESIAALRETIQNLQHENAAQAALIERAERRNTDNMPKTGLILWFTEGGVPHRFDADEGAWTPTTVSIWPAGVQAA